MTTIFWFRRDLRLDDNCGLYHALMQGEKILPVFIFDPAILRKLDDKKDPRITFIFKELKRLKKTLEQEGSSLYIAYGDPVGIFHELISQFKVSAVYANHDYEPYARERDEQVGRLLRNRNILFNTFKDQVIFEKDEILKDDGKPYTIFTPYMQKWKSNFHKGIIQFYPSENFRGHFIQIQPFQDFTLEDIGFSESSFQFPDNKINGPLIENYHKSRDIPSVQGTTRLGIHLRFGTLSIRKLVEFAENLNSAFLDELIWREFYMMILWHFPHVVKESFKKQYDFITWRNNEHEFEAWCQGKTGYPIVDAGMHELNATGFMHNRLRMITASFLTKNLLIDWRWGEHYFAGKLLDYELSSNNGGWQWAASTGCDPVPYFRIFNPDLQSKKFDPEEVYVKKWLPGFDSEHYIPRIVSLDESKVRAMRAYRMAVQED